MYTSTLFETASWLCLGCMAVPVALLLYGIMAQLMGKKRIDWRAWVIDLISMTGGGLLTALACPRLFLNSRDDKMGLLLVILVLMLAITGLTFLLSRLWKPRH